MLRNVLNAATVLLLAVSLNAGAEQAPVSATVSSSAAQSIWWPTYPYCPPLMPRQFCPKS